MKILITGGNGFIGNQILNYLDSTNYTVLNLYRNKKIKKKNIVNFKCDLSKPSSYIKRIKKFNPEILIHLAWHGIPDFNKKNCAINRKISIKLIQEISKCKSIKKIIVAGSCFEIKHKKNSCTEKKKFDTSSNFTLSKYKIFEYLKKISKKNKNKFYWLRIFYAYGPNQKKNSLIPYIYYSLKRRRMVALSNPYNKLDFVNVRDIAKYFIKIINNNTQSGIYNIGSGKSISIIQIFNFIKKILNKPKAKFSCTNQKQINFYSNNYKSRKLINFTPKMNMFDGIKQQLKVLRS